MPSVAEVITTVLKIDPAAPAVEFANQWNTWGELTALIKSLDNILASRSLGAGSRVGVLLRNRPPQLAAALMCLVSDRCLVTLNPLLPSEKLAEDIANLELPIVIGETCEFSRPAVLEAVQKTRTAAVALSPLIGESPALLTRSDVFPPNQARLFQPGVIVEMLSSGTTGNPKRIALQTKKFERAFAAGNAYEKGRSAEEAPTLRSGVVFLTLPFTHISGLWALIQTVYAGRKSFLLEKFELSSWHAGVVRHRPKLLSGPPTMLKMILDANLPSEDLKSIVALRTGAAPLDSAIVDEFLSRYGIPVLEQYGATEFAGAIAGWSIEDFRTHRVSKRGSVGRLQSGVHARIVDLDTLQPLPHGSEGLLELKSAQLEDAEQWTRTTDRAVLDTEGFLYIKGRADDAILRGGFKIHPLDVVKAIESHPSVREASVVGVSDDRLGQMPVAAIVLRQGEVVPSIDELRDYLRGRLLAYQIPAQFKFVADLPRTPSMKVSQPDVRALFSVGGF